MSKIALMNKARKDKKEDAEKLSNAQAYNLLNNQYNHLQKLYQDLLTQYKQKEDEFITSNPILNDLWQHDKKKFINMNKSCQLKIQKVNCMELICHLLPLN